MLESLSKFDSVRLCERQAPAGVLSRLRAMTAGSVHASHCLVMMRSLQQRGACSLQTSVPRMMRRSHLSRGWTLGVPTVSDGTQGWTLGVPTVSDGTARYSTWVTLACTWRVVGQTGIGAAGSRARARRTRAYPARRTDPRASRGPSWRRGPEAVPRTTPGLSFSFTIARSRLPCRVPLGLHGEWFPDAAG
jgi:hypothetical protein